MFTYNESTYLLTSGQDCSPCSLHGDKKCPKGHFKCMKELTYEKVYDTIIDKIDN
jgi:ADP-heptose:LPS heptosyltransferase